MKNVSSRTKVRISFWKIFLGMLITLFFLLTLLCSVSFIQASRLATEPFEVSLSLKRSNTYEMDFHIKNVTGNYEVLLCDNRSYGDDQKKSEDLLRQIKGTWKITHQGKEVECPDSGIIKANSWTRKQVRKEMCVFWGEPGDYHIAFTFTKKPDIVLFNEPKLTLQVGLYYRDMLDHVVVYQASIYGIIIFGGILFLLLLILYFSIRRNRKKQEEDL